MRLRLALALSAVVILTAASPAGALDTPTKHNGADGGDGLSNGMPGCGGGTDPAPDGKFYVRGTERECNPGKQDRAKLKH